MFTPPLPLPDLNTDDDDGNPHISSDGCRLYYTRASPDWNVWVATVQ